MDNNYLIEVSPDYARMLEVAKPVAKLPEVPVAIDDLFAPTVRLLKAQIIHLLGARDERILMLEQAKDSLRSSEVLLEKQRDDLVQRLTEIRWHHEDTPSRASLLKKIPELTLEITRLNSERHDRREKSWTDLRMIDETIWLITKELSEIEQIDGSELDSLVIPQLTAEYSIRA